MRMFSSKVLIKALLLAVVPTTSVIMLAQSPETPTDSGTISGVRESGLSVYKGVPFAAPRSATCVGGLRHLSHAGRERVRRMSLPQRVCKLVCRCPARRHRR